MTPCGFKWRAPYIHAPNEINNWIPREGHVEQICVLPKGHDGDHRSLTKVTAENRDAAPRLI